MKCALCKKSFTPKVVRKGPSAAKYCSDYCRVRAWTGQGPATPLKAVECALCHKSFKPGRAWDRYCSEPCKRRAAYLRRKEEGYYEAYYAKLKKKKAVTKSTSSRKSTR